MGAINNSLTGVDAGLIDNLVDVFYEKMLADYRVNRFFTHRTSQQQQADALKRVLHYALSVDLRDNEQWRTLLDNYFMVALARVEGTHSLVTGNDFMFLLDVLAARRFGRLTCSAMRIRI